MKSLTRGNFKVGYHAVRSAKTRSFWTMLGIIIGVASVITVVGIGEGIKAQISGQIHHAGADLITIRPTQITNNTDFNGGNLSLLSGQSISGNLTAADVTAIASAKGVGEVAPLTAVAGTPSGDHGQDRQGLVIGTNPTLTSLLNQSVAFGTFLTDDDNGLNNAVIGEKAAQQLFNQSVPLGRTFSFRGQQFTVNGIMNEFSDTPLSQEVDFNNAIFIPNDVAETLTNNTAPTFEVLAKPANTRQTKQTAGAISGALNRLHGGISGFAVLQQGQTIQNNGGILELLTRLIAGVAAISLLVGGIGIMNVMLVSVAERMHEIGIRKALGATNRQILSQFVTEATVLSTIGGALGIVTAIVIDLGLRVATDLQPRISWQIVVLATATSVAVGIIFGSVPALKAARKDPIEALRAE